MAQHDWLTTHSVYPIKSSDSRSAVTVAVGHFATALIIRMAISSWKDEHN